MPTIIYERNEKGPVLSYAKESGVKIIEQDGLKFKNLSRSGKLEPYEDWRRSPQERAKDLASRLTPEQIIGLMMHTGMQSVPGMPGPFGDCTINGVPAKESGAPAWTISDQQKKAVGSDFLRHMLFGMGDNLEDIAHWYNDLQAMCEEAPWGVPMNNSSDPRHGSDHSQEFNIGAGKVVSLWPEGIGLAATFDPELVKAFGRVMSKEYRAMGISTALSPQIDLATEPRWGRFSGTFGGGTQLSVDLAKAVCDGMQTTLGDDGREQGWGSDSVVAMVKHWPGGGSVEAGRDAHYAYGKYAVYPGNQFQTHLKPFTEGAFALEDGTQRAAAVMPYYTISWKQDPVYGENVGNSYSKYMITDLLRNQYHYDDVVCTDWGITMDPGPEVNSFNGKCWGVENLTVPERMYKIIKAGVDQFGDVMELDDLLRAYDLGVQEQGEEKMLARIRKSAERILTNTFRLGLFENPYLDVSKAKEIVGCREHVEQGMEAQRKSVILLKNKNQVMPIREKKTVYIPQKYIPETSIFGRVIPEKYQDPIPMDVVEQYYHVTEHPDEADFAIVFISSPFIDLALCGYSDEDKKAGGNGYVPMSLQYGSYTADAARQESIAGGDPREPFVNRSYQGKTVTARNAKDPLLVHQTRALMGEKPVITVLQYSNPTIPAEFEPVTDGILVHSGVDPRVVMEAISGQFEPSGLLPCQFPANMETVERHCEDMPCDLICYQDSEGHSYDFAYGMNWSGVIQDWRTERYKMK